MASLSSKELSRIIRDKAAALGFDACGIAGAGLLEEDAGRLRAWLEGNRHGQMKYMENYFDKRTDPSLLFPGARSVIVLLQNYFPSKNPDNKDTYKISKYAYGEDYHFVMKKKMASIVDQLGSEEIGAKARAFVDSAPVLERAWAREAGLGWIGKNTCLITKEKGSFFFIGVIITDAALESDEKFIPNHCGGCTRCLDACPTGALGKDGLDARKCISYLTIENREEKIPERFRGRMEDWVFGCDICQDVCPWNRLSEPHHQQEFDPPEKLLKMTRADWHGMDEKSYSEQFRRSPLKRAKFSGIKRNIDFVRKD